MPDTSSPPSTSPPSTLSIQGIKADVSQFRGVALDRHRRGTDSFRVVEGFSDSIDGILRQLFSQELDAVQDQVAMVAIGGYGRKQLCPHSDIDLLFIQDGKTAEGPIERLVRLLWDGGFDLGQSVRTPAECLKFMMDDIVTAATLLENRYLTGSRRLYERFEAEAVNKYRKKCKEAFAAAKLEQLRQSIIETGRTIYVLEPHLKDGMCALRDIQRVLWIENMRRSQGTFEALAAGGSFPEADAQALKEAYGFLLRVRCELHFTTGLKQDVLEIDSASDVARNLGYGDDRREAVEALMADYYRHARRTYRFLRHYIETGTQGQRFLAKLHRKIFTTQVKPYLSLYDSTLFLRGEPDAEQLAEEILDIFVLAHRQDLRISESLREWIRSKAEDPRLDFMHSTVIHRGFISILREGGNSGRILKVMHKTGVLGRILPEFAQLEGLVQFDGHHQFTVDEHTLRTLQELDSLERGEGEAEFRTVLASIEDRLPLRMALLLHDIGKAVPGDHSASGSEAAVRICERLGLLETQTEAIEFLVYRHLAMSRVSEERDFSEDDVVEFLAKLVGSEARLKMLYLLTHIDIASVGQGTWTSWKGVQLAELYQRTLACLRTGKIPEQNLDEALVATGLSSEDRIRVLEHCRLVGKPAYARETIPERMLFHLKMVDRFLETRTIQVSHDSSLGYHELTFCCQDRPRLFADFTGVLFAEGLNVLAARIFSRSDDIALDLFDVEVADDVKVDFAQRAARIRQKLELIEARKISVEDLVREWERRNRFRKAFRPRWALYGAKVSVDNEASARFTVIDVNAGDRPGLLYSLASTLNRLSLDVRTAKVSTATNRARDVFYVLEADGKKVVDPARKARIVEDLGSAAAGEFAPAPAVAGGAAS